MLLTTLLCLVLLTIFTYQHLNNIVYVCRDTRQLRLLLVVLVLLKVVARGRFIYLFIYFLLTF